MSQLLHKHHFKKLARPGDLKAIQQGEKTYGLTPDASRLTPHTQPKVVIWGTGTPRREFLYSDDMAEATLFLAGLPDDQITSLLTPDSSPLINIGCGKDLTIRELAELVRDVVGFTGNLTFDPSKPDGTMQKLLDVIKLNKLGWKATTPLRDGIIYAYEAYLVKASRK